MFLYGTQGSHTFKAENKFGLWELSISQAPAGHEHSAMIQATKMIDQGREWKMFFHPESYPSVCSS